MQIYLVGGAVRDFLLNLPVTDKDWVVVNASTQEMLNLGFLPIGKDFPVFLHPKTHEQYALARTERKKGRGYTGFQCQTSANVTLEEDLMRRDLTINAMAMTQEGVIIDPYHGQQDIAQKILRHVSPAFIEDPVRILRIARLMARLADIGFSIAPETMVMMKAMVSNGEVDALVSDRVWQEMNQALSTHSPAYFFDTLNHCGALAKLFPEWLHHILAIQRMSFKLNNKKINFAKLALLLTRSEIKAFCERYPVPVDYRELAIMATMLQSDLMGFAQDKQLKPDSVLRLFEQADAFRRPDRFGELLMVFEDTDKLRQLFDQVKHKIPSETLTSLLKKGFTGKQLGEKIKFERLNKLKKILSDGT